MHCRNNNCGYQFCWSCMQDWSVHGYNQGCNRYEPKNEEIEHSRTALQRYMHYYDRFMNHKKSLKAEDKVIVFLLHCTSIYIPSCFSSSSRSTPRLLKCKLKHVIHGLKHNFWWKRLKHFKTVVEFWCTHIPLHFTFHPATPNPFLRIINQIWNMLQKNYRVYSNRRWISKRMIFWHWNKRLVY